MAACRLATASGGGVAATDGTNLARGASYSLMTDNPSPFAHLSLERAIALRWTLRDIKARRLKLSPPPESDLKILVELGLIEIRDEGLVLTTAGHNALD